MGWYSLYGCGVGIYGIRPSENEGGRIEFTSWISVFYIPLLPLKSWSAIYIGERLPDGLTDEGHMFTDLKKIPHEIIGLIQTFSRGLLALVVAIMPSAYMIYRTAGRGANKIEAILAIASALWLVALIILTEHKRKTELRVSEQDSDGERR